MEQPTCQECQKKEELLEEYRIFVLLLDKQLEEAENSLKPPAPKEPKNESLV